MQSQTLHGVLFREGDWWVGQWLEYDISAQAKTLKDLTYELHRSLVGHIVICMQEGLKPFENMRKAPEEYWTLFQNGLKVLPENERFQVPQEISLPEVELRAAA